MSRQQAEGAALDIRHVVIDRNTAQPSGANGVHNVVRALIREQRAHGDAARLVIIAQGMPAPSDPDIPTQVINLQGLWVSGHMLRLSRGVLAALFADVGPRTVFHLHSSREPSLPALSRELRRRGLPYGMTIHGRYSHVFDTDGRRLKTSTALYLQWLERPVLNGARFVQALSPEEAAIIRQVAPRCNVALIRNGAYASRLGRPRQPPPRQASAGFPRFVYCGRYATHHKGLDLLFEGLALYTRSGGQGRLTTIGTGPDRPELEAMAERLGICDVLDIRDPLFGAMRDRALHGSDFFVMASRYEGLPLAALEAGLLGMPLMISPGTGLSGAVEAHGAGVAIQAASAEAVCAAMHAAESLGPCQWQRRAEAAHRMVREIGDWTAITGELREHYLP